MATTRAQSRAAAASVAAADAADAADAAGAARARGNASESDVPNVTNNDAAPDAAAAAAAEVDAPALPAPAPPAPAPPATPGADHADDGHIERFATPSLLDDRPPDETRGFVRTELTRPIARTPAQRRNGNGAHDVDEDIVYMMRQAPPTETDPNAAFEALPYAMRSDMVKFFSNAIRPPKVERLREPADVRAVFDFLHDADRTIRVNYFRSIATRARDIVDIVARALGNIPELTEFLRRAVDEHKEWSAFRQALEDHIRRNDDRRDQCLKVVTMLRNEDQDPAAFFRDYDAVWQTAGMTPEKLSVYRAVVALNDDHLIHRVLNRNPSSVEQVKTVAQEEYRLMRTDPAYRARSAQAQAAPDRTADPAAPRRTQGPPLRDLPPTYRSGPQAYDTTRAPQPQQAYDMARAPQPAPPGLAARPRDAASRARIVEKAVIRSLQYQDLPPLPRPPRRLDDDYANTQYLEALREYRRAHNLCYFCGSREHSVVSCTEAPRGGDPNATARSQLN